MEKEVIDFIFTSKDFPSIKEISAQTSASISTISNLVRKLGFLGYKEFMYDYKNSINPLKKEVNNNSVKKQIYNHYLKQINAFYEMEIDIQHVNEVCKLMTTHNIFMYGVGSNKHILNDMKNRMSKLNKYVDVIQGVDEIKNIP
jgi:DNA-binding MurR/RpiR family transcriptional regulator